MYSSHNLTPAPNFIFWQSIPKSRRLLLSTNSKFSVNIPQIWSDIQDYILQHSLSLPFFQSLDLVCSSPNMELSTWNRNTSDDVCIAFHTVTYSDTKWPVISRVRWKRYGWETAFHTNYTDYFNSLKKKMIIIACDNQICHYNKKPIIQI